MMSAQLAIDLRADAVGFAVVSVVSILAARLYLRRRHGVAASPGRRTWTATILLILLAAVGAEAAGKLESRRLVDMLQGIAPMYAIELERMGHASITPDTAADDPAYLAMIDAEKRWLAANPTVHDIYTMARRPDGQIVLLVDSETDYDRDGKIDADREQRTPIGEPYPEHDPGLERALTGEANFDGVPYTDRWGTWVGSWVPMHDGEGKVNAVLGVDYDAAEWSAAILRSRVAALMGFGMVMAILQTSAFGISLLRGELARREAVEHALRQSQSHMRNLALHDRLTGLPNRAVLADRLGRAIARARRDPTYHFAVLFLDFDGFKVVNDSLGHQTGDRLLCAISERLGGTLRGLDTVSSNTAGGAASLRPASGDLTTRLGGDEFVILLDGIAGPPAAISVARRLQAALAEPYAIEGHDIRSTASIGIACYDERYQSPDELLRDADIAMYRAKAAGKGCHVMFDPSMHEQAVARLNAETDLRRALETGAMDVAFQPIVRLDSGELVGFEALARWTHPTRGNISPAEFIPLAEETGLIVPLGDWVFQTACRQLSEWRTRFPHLAELSVSINVSRRQFDSGELAERFSAVLRANSLEPRHVKLEITESVIMRDPAGAARQLERLREAGIRLTVDDFGTGHSSLSCLHRFTVNGLKLDRTFIEEIGHRRDHSAVVGAVVTLARNLDLELIAEGVESIDQAGLLLALGCELGQGFLFARPLNKAQADEMLAEGGNGARVICPGAACALPRTSNAA